MKNRTLVFTLILTGILVLSGYTIFRLYSVNERNKAALPYLMEGEGIKYFNILNHQASLLDQSVLKEEMPSLIFIFSRPCSPCNKNISYWKKMAKILDGKVNIYGIVLDEPGKAFDFAEQAKLNFKIYIPEDLRTFIQTMRLKMNLSQTIIYHNGAVRKLKIGDLDGKEASGFIKAIRGIS